MSVKIDYEKEVRSRFGFEGKDLDNATFIVSRIKADTLEDSLSEFDRMLTEVRSVSSSKFRDVEVLVTGLALERMGLLYDVE